MNLVTMDMQNLFFSAIALLFSSVTTQANDVVRYNISAVHPDAKQRYYIDLLTSILEASSDKYGGYQLIPVNLEMSQGRMSMMLKHGQIVDVTWRMTTKALESELQAIYIPLLKGLLGGSA